MKGRHYGELTALKDNLYITLEQYGDTKRIRKEDVTKKHIIQAGKGLSKALAEMLSDKYDILILDEINVAIWFDLLKTEDVLTFLDKRPEHMEVILTGRNDLDKLIEAADIVSEIKEIRHYYNVGIAARDGIER